MRGAAAASSSGMRWLGCGWWGADRQVLGAMLVSGHLRPSSSHSYETTANALSFCVYLLAAHPGEWVGGTRCLESWSRRPAAGPILALPLLRPCPLHPHTHASSPLPPAACPPADKEAKLLAEVDAFGRGRAPAPADLDARFPYAAAALAEALRLYPPAAMAVRESKPGMALGGVEVPAGTALQVRGGQQGSAVGRWAASSRLPRLRARMDAPRLRARAPACAPACAPARLPTCRHHLPPPPCHPTARSTCTPCTAASAGGATPTRLSPSASWRAAPRRQRRAAGGRPVAAAAAGSLTRGVGRVRAGHDPCVAARSPGAARRRRTQRRCCRARTCPSATARASASATGLPRRRRCWPWWHSTRGCARPGLAGVGGLLQD